MVYTCEDGEWTSDDRECQDEEREEREDCEDGDTVARGDCTYTCESGDWVADDPTCEP